MSHKFLRFDFTPDTLTKPDPSLSVILRTDECGASLRSVPEAVAAGASGVFGQCARRAGHGQPRRRHRTILPKRKTLLLLHQPDHHYPLGSRCHFYQPVQGPFSYYRAFGT